METLRPTKNCKLCIRLYDFRSNNKKKYPSYYNGAIPIYGDRNAELLIIGLAPGLKGANNSGRPFTGDYAGEILYHTLAKYNYLYGEYNKNDLQKFSLKNCAITNAVKCVPPNNKPNANEINNCQRFLLNDLASLKNIKAVLTLGRIAHNSLIKILNLKISEYPFKHNTEHKLNNLKLFNSYHCSRYNINTKRLTLEMFEDVFENIDYFIKNT
jgi:uracil-DNA glycosylase